MGHTDLQAPSLAICDALEQDMRFGRLQIEASDPVHEDLLAGARSGQDARAHWDAIAAQARLLAQAHADVRLHVLLYRAELAQRGLLPAAQRLAALGRAAAATEPAADGDTAREAAAAALAYFFSEAHLRELQASRFEADAPAVRTVLALQAAPAPAAAAERGKARAAAPGSAAASAEASRTDVATWLAQQRDLLPRLKGMREALRALARSHGHCATLRAMLRKERVGAWLGRLDAALLALGAVAQPDPVIGLVGRVGADGAAAHGPDTQTHAAATAPGPGAPQAVGTIVLDPEKMRRVDVVALIQIANRWFAQNEPGSPAPYFLARALALMNADFQEIVRNLMPEALPQFNKLAGLGDRS